MLATPYYIYRHIRTDTNDVFYIGKGKNRRNKYDYERAHCKTHSRNKLWKNIVKKCGDYKVEIMMEFDNHDACVAKEKEMIELYGRRNLSLGPLANLTDGGDGSCGIIVSPELRKKRSENAKGQRSKAWTEAIRKARKNGGNGGVVKFGDKLPRSWRESLSKSKIGKKNPMHGRCGKNHPTAKRVINVKTSKIYESITEAAKICDYDMKQLHGWLSGYRKNPTDLRLL